MQSGRTSFSRPSPLSEGENDKSLAAEMISPFGEAKLPEGSSPSRFTKEGQSRRGIFFNYLVTLSGMAFSLKLSIDLRQSILVPFRIGSTKGMQIFHQICVVWVVLVMLPAEIGLAAEDSAYGPEISVPREIKQPNEARLHSRNRIDQTVHEAFLKSRGCLECHKGIEEMHASPHVVLGCTDCHGGNPNPGLTQRAAHVQPRNPIFWESSANPNDSSVLLNHESPEFIQFVNPGDLRVAVRACGICHREAVEQVNHSMMNHGAMLWGAALYNNGSVPHKNYRYGQAYASDGAPLRLVNPTRVTPELTRSRGILPYLDPLPHYAVSQAGNILRALEQGGEAPSQLGLPVPTDLPGRPPSRISDRGLGTLGRVDAVVLNLQKMRLHDPLLGFLGSNNHPGDYRSSGCSACHVVYANDRSPTHSDWYSKYGHQGLSFSGDPMIPKNERGHPIKHQFTRAIPSSQCMNCHMHQGNLFVNPFLGYTWWDQESDGELMYPAKQKNPTDAELLESLRHNPEAAAAKGLWGDLDFLEKVAELNPQLRQTQFADYHGHGWVFRAVFKKDRKGNLLTLEDEVIPHDDPKKFSRAVHLKDVHLARGMQCVDCHFLKDVHGNGKLYGEPRAATTIECIDCHGTISTRPTLITSGNGGQIDLRESSTASGPRFQWEGTRLFQRSSLDPVRRWEIPQTKDTIDPQSNHYNPKSRHAKTLRRDGMTWGDVPPEYDCGRTLAHDNSNISCTICHSSWATSCFGCHLSSKTNMRASLNKFEGTMSRILGSYNPQVVRDDVFMLCRDSTVKSNRLAVGRSSSAVVVSSQNANREWTFAQQQTISAEGYSGQAFNPHFPHTTSGVGTTKNCSDCHISKENDNNAVMAQLLGLGTGTVNFFGRTAYVGAGKDGVFAVNWTEMDEPQAAIGSHLHKIAYPDSYAAHLGAEMVLKDGFQHEATEILDLTLRGEYLYTANGPDGFVVFDAANIQNKAFSQRLATAPVSPLGQRLQVRTKYATSVALPATQALDPARRRLPENEEQAIHSLYAYVYVTDRDEGLVIVNIATLVDGDPANNFLRKDVVFNPDGKLAGATSCFVAGHRLFVTARQGLFVIAIDDPLKPRLVGELANGFLRNPRAIAIQFRYAFVTDEEGLKVIDITTPSAPVPLSGATVKLANAQRLYLARTYAYVANGSEGLAIIDIEKPAQPRLEQTFTAEGQLNDTRAVQIGSVSASMFALLADGRNGLQVIQLISPDTVPGHMGFSPRPEPRLIATFPTRGIAVAVSRGLDRDRIVDETGHQTVVFGRRGARPLNGEEMSLFYRRSSVSSAESAESLYQADDVVFRSGRLLTRKGGVISEPVPFTASERLLLQAPAGGGVRLMRRED
jgi:hypothetical protein